MAGLVGDLIMNVRALGPDNPSVIAAPTILSATDSGPLPPPGGFLSTGTYRLVCCWLTSWGVSLPSSESTVAVTNSGISVQVADAGAGGTPDSIIGLRVYLTQPGGASGTETQFVDVTGSDFTTGNTALVRQATNVGTPPVRSSAYLPDTDGSFVSASTMYRWLNDALQSAARITNGIQDTCGISSISGMRRYTAPGQWLRFDQCFYDGWELDLGNKAETFRNRNLTANIAISLMVDAQSNTTRIELYWTPSRTAGSTTTSGTLLATDTQVSINPPTGWLLQDGFAQVGDEILSYSAQTSSQLRNVIRGWSGTRVPASLLSGNTVSELNIELNGYRMPATYSVGDASLTLGVPPGWEPFLEDLMLGSFRMAEQETEEGRSLQSNAAKGLESWAKSNKPVAGPRQMRMYGDYGLRGTVPGGLTGPIIIP